MVVKLLVAILFFLMFGWFGVALVIGVLGLMAIPIAIGIASTILIVIGKLIYSKIQMRQRVPKLLAQGYVQREDGTWASPTMVGVSTIS